MTLRIHLARHSRSPRLLLPVVLLTLLTAPSAYADYDFSNPAYAVHNTDDGSSRADQTMQVDRDDQQRTQRDDYIRSEKARIRAEKEAEPKYWDIATGQRVYTPPGSNQPSPPQVRSHWEVVPNPNAPTQAQPNPFNQDDGSAPVVNNAQSDYDDSSNRSSDNPAYMIFPLALILYALFRMFRWLLPEAPSTSRPHNFDQGRRPDNRTGRHE
jgi:hypothetical protein